jgi:2-keto-3-deoxy-L-rhamnonate aldolase RhmA
VIERGQRGLFIKTPSPHVVEVLGTAGLDFAVIDAEHGPFDRAALDVMMLAGRAAGLPLFVRVADQQASAILGALDLGAVGVVVPHVDTVEIARAIAASARYRGGSRGYSGAPRHAGYGTIPMRAVIAAADEVRVIVQIEHPDAVPRAAEILALEGVDGILVGRADLAIAMGEEDSGAARVDDAVRELFASVRTSEKIKGVVVSSEPERSRYADQGANWFIMGNDQGLLRSAAVRLLADGSGETSS